MKPYPALMFAAMSLWTSGAAAAEPSAQQLQQQLLQFLDGASRNDPVQHGRFWADELVYTSSRGTRFDKGTLMDGVNEAPTLAPSAVTTWYGAEEINIRVHNDSYATLTFTLTADDVATPGIEHYYLNSGTFVWRDQRWQAIVWHATVKAPSQQTP
ncbi:nuclear transport factor 2 family protein [Aestuariibacter halophilus]|uniref:Nuclear transport factor 2 family protein n=1 Tax=Fluctibacter halophilus TaxID=226011 RepID=A0ABS8G638_9ALTE|nr:nuclear transport factor 2 family protein [Aestuariibacter halophilus]MCC2615873.1 nuclear transport factor 2 family protein [Aestuariibacter halophilus]